MKQRGLSLVEVLVAGGLLSLFLLFSIPALQSSQVNAEDALGQQAQLCLAHQMMEQALVEYSRPPEEAGGSREVVNSINGQRSSLKFEWSRTEEQIGPNKIAVRIEVSGRKNRQPVVLESVRFWEGGSSL